MHRRSAPTVVVRRATVDDVDSIVALREAVAAEGIWIGAEAPIDRDRDRQNTAATIERQVDGRSCLMLVATADGAVIGTLFLGNARGVAGLGMNVAAEFRGVGVGSALMQAALDWAGQAGAHKIELEVWPWNRRARHLYEKFSFVEEGYRRRHYRRRDGSLWDAVVMARVLDSDAPGHEPRAAEPPGGNPGAETPRPDLPSDHA